MTKRRAAAMLGGTPTAEDWLCLPQNPTNELRKLKKQLETIKRGVETRSRRRIHCAAEGCINRLKGRPDKDFCSDRCRLAAHLQAKAKGQAVKSTHPTPKD